MLVIMEELQIVGRAIITTLNLLGFDLSHFSFNRVSLIKRKDRYSVFNLVFFAKTYTKFYFFLLHETNVAKIKRRGYKSLSLLTAYMMVRDVY